MKQGNAIGLLLLLSVLSACHRPIVETPNSTSKQQELSAIDSLLWTQPDSALARLLPCCDTVSDRHYANLLLAELLYKNYYEQTNRGELLKAVGYYDSLANAHGTSRQRFLAARAHYINGVGYYELDSVVPACEEYLKAVEIMEESFSEKELVGKKAQFMALTYTHICGLFSDQYLHEQAIYFGKQALLYYDQYDATAWHKAWILDEIGLNFDMMEQWDSASYYYKKAIAVLPDTNNLVYRDVMAAEALLQFNSGKAPKQAKRQLQHLVALAEDQQEFLARSLNISEIYFQEKNYDSARIYLNTVFDEIKLIDAKRQAAEWLVEICKFQGENPEVYADFLVPFANKEENKSEIKSQLTVLYNIFCQKKLELQYRYLTINRTLWVKIILSGLVLIFLIGVLLYHKKKKMVAVLTNQIIEEQSITRKRNSFDCFLSETICQEIILSTQGKNIKRSAVPQDYPELILNDSQLQQLALIVNRYFGPFESRLEQFSISFNPCLVNLCHLYLLGINEKQAAILLNRDYSSIKRYEKKLKKGFNTKEELVVFMRKIILMD